MERSRVSFVRIDEDFAAESERSSPAETIEELAARVLFSDTLREKLRPATILRSQLAGPGKPNARLPEEPGRPDFLRFARSNEARPSLPSAASLVDEENRGVLLHFFANHELLAAELMALALLKFPDAPEAFRAGLAETLREEQRHTRWYLNRLEKCGVEFGQYPVNRFFWDAVSGMETPIDYVSRLCLTFEQANLDYALHFSNILGEAGDSESAAILDRIYRDEISHVGYGLQWFREWKNPGESDWVALEKQLHFPLSPSRAKGNRAIFNEGGRREAGFDEEYIRRLSLFERSRGRTPNVFYFNPETENRIAQHPLPYTAPSRIQSVIEDLELLPAFLARRDDVVLMRGRPSEKHLAFLRDAGFVIPEIEEFDRVSSGLLRSRKINQFRPWGKSPDLEGRFGFLAENSALPQPGLRWEPSDRDLFSKIEQAGAFPSEFGFSIPVRSNEDLSAAIEAFANQNATSVLLKRAFSTAGGGMKRLSLDDLKESVGKSVSIGIAREGGFLLEPLHRRLFDFSVQYEMSESGLRRVGLTEQLIAESGGYRGTISFPKFCAGLDPDIARFLMTEALPLYDEESAFSGRLFSWLKDSGYEGPVGVDAYLYEDDNGQLRHRIACEVNTRYTMGRVAHEIRRQIAPECGLRFEILKASEVSAPLTETVFTNGKLAAGSLILTEITPDTYYVAKITVAKRRDDL